MSGKKATDKPVRVEGEKTEKVGLTAAFGTVYVKVKGNEIMRPIRAQMALLDKAGHFYKIQKKYSISSEGYTHLNKVASVSIVTPQKVIVDGREQPNPYIERNETTKMIEGVHIRKIGIGLSPVGNITVRDKTLYYHIYSYFIQSIQAKMEKIEWESGKPTDKKIHPDCAAIGTAKKEPEKKGSWEFFPTVPPLGIWVNYEDPAIIDCLKEHTQRQRFGDRIAQTIVERNILKDHPAIGVSTVHPNEAGKAYVTVYGYRHEFGPPQISEILEQAERGSETIDAESEVIDTMNHEEEAEVIKEAAETEEEAPKVKKEKKDAKTEKKTPAELKEPPEDLVLESERVSKEEAEET